MSKIHWRENAEYVSDGDHRILGEDDNGDLYVSCCPADLGPIWDRRFNPRNPLHWSFYVRSRLTNRIAFLEHA